MEKMCITMKELAYLASELGAREMFGIRDPFYGMTREEIRNELPALQADLDKKEILEMNFTGESKLTEKAEKLISVCAFCEAYAVCDFDGDKGERTITAYWKGGRWAVLEHDHENADLYPCEREKLEALIGAAMPAQSREEVEKTEPAHFSCELIGQAHGLLQNGQEEEAAAALLAGGMSRTMADMMLAGLRGEGRLCPVAGVSLRKNEVRSMIGIVLDRGILCLEQDAAVRGGSMWNADLCSTAQYRQKTADLLREMEATAP